MQGASLHKTAEIVPLRSPANRLGALGFRLVLAMIVSYLAMMAFFDPQRAARDANHRSCV